MHDLREETVRVGEVGLSLLRPSSPDALLDEEAFAQDEFLPYWAELWPAASALAAVLPAELQGLRVVELGCGLGVPSLVAARRGADVVATDWAVDALELLGRNAERNGVGLTTRLWDWREPWAERFDLALAADVLYERRNVEPVVAALRRLAPEAIVALAGRPYEGEFLRSVGEEAVRRDRPARSPCPVRTPRSLRRLRDLSERYQRGIRDLSHTKAHRSVTGM